MTTIKLRRGTAAAWTAANPTLASGEPGFETDTGKLKIGDGSTAWNSLAYENLTGPQGPQGVQGATGSAGAQGATGTQGNQGTQGTAGAQGVQGSQGNQGTTGPQGSTGAQGATGTQGATGAQGVQGSQGTTGTQGPQGFQGATGTQGNQGTTGATGAQGTQGFQGAQGTQGTQGTQGPQGATGATGAQGTQGTQGVQGANASIPLPRHSKIVGWSLDPAAAATSTILTAGKVHVVKVPISDAATLSTVLLNLATNGGTLTTNQCQIGVYSVSGDVATRQLLAGNVGSSFTSGGGTAGTANKAIAADSGATYAYAGGADAFIYVAFVFNGSVMPTIARGTGVASAVNLGLAAADGYRVANAGTGQTSLPPNFNLSALTEENQLWLVGVK